MSQPLAATVLNSFCSLRMLPQWDGEATVIAKSSMYKPMSPLGIDICKGETYNRTSRREIGDPWGVPAETREERLGDPWNTRVQVLSKTKEETQSTM